MTDLPKYKQEIKRIKKANRMNFNLANYLSKHAPLNYRCHSYESYIDKKTQDFIYYILYERESIIV